MEISVIADGSAVVEKAGEPVRLGAHTYTTKIDIQADENNTGIIAVGGPDVDATSTGVFLNAGDFYSLEISNLGNVFIDSTVDGEGVRYTYYSR